MLPQLVDSYNNTIHSSIGIAPAQVVAKNERSVFWYQYMPKSKSTRTKQSPFNIVMGDHVRLTHLKRTLREYDETYTGEIFEVTRRFRRQGSPIYRLSDLVNEPLSGTFYQTELQKVDVDDDNIWKVDRVLKTRKRKNSEKEMLVRWLYFPSKFDSWVKASDFENL